MRALVRPPPTPRELRLSSSSLCAHATASWPLVAVHRCAHQQRRQKQRRQSGVAPPSTPPPAAARPRRRPSVVAAASASPSASSTSTSLEAAAAARHDGLATAGEETIASVVTGPPGQGAVSIIRVSGPRALAVAAAVFRPAAGGASGKEAEWRPRSHRVYYGVACDPSASSSSANGGSGSSSNGSKNNSAEVAAAPTTTTTTTSPANNNTNNPPPTIDEILLIPMLSPRSYTREDVVELHCHGGAVCTSRVLSACLAQGCRPARPGEFTLRAFLNGRLDLAQAEAVAELVSARSPAAADSALAGVTGGGVGAEVASLRAALLSALAEVEARIDFEEDVGPVDRDDIASQIAESQRRVEGALRTARAGSLLRRGLQVAIVGRPNVGKSSLLNAWTGSSRAIVTPIAGTTRDVVEAGLVIAGAVPVTLLDTAGIRSEAADEVEAIGVARSVEAARGADVVVMVADAEKGWTPGDGEIFDALWGAGGRERVVRGEAILVWNKADLVVGGDGQEATAAATAEPPQLPMRPRDVFGGASRRRVVRTSALTKSGIDDLERALLDAAGAPQIAATGGRGWAVNERQAEALVRAHEALAGAAASVEADLPLDCWTVDLRAALLALGEVGGEEVAEEVLDSVFSRFCIGK